MYKLCVLVLTILVTACGTRPNLAPVVELKWQPQNQRLTHTVRRGETLYAIAFRYDQDYRQLAAMNRLRSPYALRIGQILRVRSAVSSVSARRLVSRQRTQANFAPVASHSSLRALHPVSRERGGRGISLAAQLSKIKGGCGRLMGKL